MKGTSDNELLERMHAGDTGALGVIYMRYSAAVTEFAYRFIRDREEVADITHNIFYKLWEERLAMKKKCEDEIEFHGWFIVSGLVFGPLHKPDTSGYPRP